MFFGLSCRFIAPNNFVLEVFGTEDRIQHNLQIMAGGRVTVQVQAAGGLEHPVQLHQPGSHHHQVCHHLVCANEVTQGADHFDNSGGGGSDQVVVGGFGGGSPMPGIVKGGQLGFRGGAGFVLEEDVVGAVGVEGWVEVDEINGFGGDVLAQDGEVIPIEEGVAGDGFGHGG